MATPRKVRKAKAGKKTRAKGNNEKPSVKDYWQLLDYRTYLRNSKRWVALCVVKGSNGVELKLYDWMWRGEKKGWNLT